MLSKTSRRVRPDLPPVILLGGTTNALAIARSLGRRGIEVWSLNGATSQVRYSRYSRLIPLPEGSVGNNEQQAWLDWLTTTGPKSFRGAVVLPCSDDALELVSKNRATLEKDYVLSEANDEMTLAMLDKAKTNDLARRAGVPIPRTWELQKREDLLEILDEIPYPCALKPCHSHEFQRHYPSRKLFVVENEKQLIDRFNAAEELGLSMLLSEIITGGDDRLCSYFTYIDESGEPLFHFTKHKLRQYPIHFGIGTYHISDWSPAVAELGLAFFRAIGIRGLAYVEFKRDSRDGQLKLIECNPRFSAATELLVLSGIDLPLFVYNRLTGGPLPPTEHYRKGVRLVRPLEDFAAFRQYNRRGELSTANWLGSFLHPWHTAYFRWRDPWPSVAQAVHQLRYQIGKRLVRPILKLLGWAQQIQEPR